MINLIKNPKKRLRKTISNDKKTISFRANVENTLALKSICNTSKFVNEAINFYRKAINEPMSVMIELRKKNPEMWRYINRRKFYPGGKF